MEQVKNEIKKAVIKKDRLNVASYFFGRCGKNFRKASKLCIASSRAFLIPFVPRTMSLDNVSDREYPFSVS